VYSTSTTCKEERVTATEDELDIEDIQGFITCVHNEQWWLACVLTVNEEDNDVRASFLHPPGPPRSFKYPSRSDILTFPAADVLTKVDPRTTTGHIYTLSQKESHEAMQKL